MPNTAAPQSEFHGAGAPSETGGGKEARLRSLEKLAKAEDTLKGSAALDREAGRACSPKTLVAAEVLCQDYDALNLEADGLWSGRLRQIRTWLRSLEPALTGAESVEELQDWQEWIETGHASLWAHGGMGDEGADASERLQCAVSLERQVVSGLEERLGEQDPVVLKARITLTGLYVEQESIKGVGPVTGEDHLIRLMERDRRPLGSVAETNLCLFPDPEAVLTACRELVERCAQSIAGDLLVTCEAWDVLARAYELAGRPEEAIPLRRGSAAAYSGINGPTCRETMRLNYLLIEDCRRAGQWNEAIDLQTHRLKRARADELPDLPLEYDRLCTLYLSCLWQDKGLTRDQVRELLAKLLAVMEELKPLDRRRYLDSAWQWCREYARDGLNDAAADVALALADALSFENDVIDLLEPWTEEESLSAARRCAVLLRLGRAYRETRSGRERSVELLEDLVEALGTYPEANVPDRGTALLELGRSRRKLAGPMVGDDFQRTAEEMLEAFREALSWREEHLPPEDPAADTARFELACALAWVGVREEAGPLLETVAAFRRKNLGEGARETVEAELELAAVLARTEGHYEQALALFQKARGRIEELHLPVFTFRTQYALYRGAGGTLSFMEWQGNGEPEHD